MEHRSVWWSRMACCGGVLAGVLLAGCAATESSSALALYREQQEQQAMIQQKQDEVDRANRPTKPELVMSMIRQSQDQGRWFASLAYIDAYRQQFGESVDLTRVRADALRMTAQPEAAEQAYRALLSGPQAGAGWRGLGLLAGGQGDFARAAEDLGKAAAAYPTDALVLSDLGYARLRAGDAAGARVPLGQAAELEPGNAKVLGNLALLLLREGDVAGANRVMEQAALSPDARARVQALAAEMRVSAPRPRVVSSTSGVSPASMGARAPTVANANADASAGSTALFGLQPLMDRFGAQAASGHP
ncbi:tetratricopeptide repeat protein [Bordetella sp. LUAb4]|uniref:tetratricopeptide repeat protein n=1 Tax=Bordetella sp. LUAb4 TaxID=2843195 RepID=UPI001E4C7710|nr:tetratricopeptide repeat protein [Bordetella sp. LUAb4]